MAIVLTLLRFKSLSRPHGAARDQVTRGLTTRLAVSERKPDSELLRTLARLTRGRVRAVVVAVEKSRARERRRDLLELARLYEDAGRQTEATDCSREWIAGFETSGEPRSEKSRAVNVLVHMAHFALVRGQAPEAVSLCRQARRIRDRDEVDLLEGRAQLEVGESGEARRCYERYITCHVSYLRGRFGEVLQEAEQRA